MNPPHTLVGLKDEELLMYANQTNDTLKKAALLDLLKLRTAHLKLKDELARFKRKHSL